MIERTMSRQEFKALIQGKIRVYDTFEQIQHGYFKVSLNGKYGLLDSSYRQVLEPIYISIDVVKKNVIVASKVKQAYEIFSESGLPIINRVFNLKFAAIKYANCF